MAITEQQRKELAAFLRNRRERLTPEAVGIKNSYGRRRTPGLRREELAQLAGVSVTWYTWLEQARKIRVSGQVLNGLARALRLDATETRHLFRLAGELPPAVQSPCSRDRIPAQYLTFLEFQDPLPAFIVNHRFDVLAWNQGFCALFPYFETLEQRRRNTLVMMFDERARDMHPHWEQDTMEAVALFRAQVADHLAHPEYAKMIDGLKSEYPEFRELWQRLDLAPSGPSVRVFDHPILGRIELGYVKLHLAATDATLVVYQPVLDNRLLVRFRDLVEERIKVRLHTAGAGVRVGPSERQTISMV
ncbi:helix-turn-helix transcriptional regulator [Streptomyces torulosus]|uniref:helix-turn-helix transcriptional regulator n=1 Tax=Streptomyces torulosus TaxID=68276 RepID=UPI00099E9529|nr:helix-turn-helix transcriptional regulator [Streptomyces torulosus]